MLSGNSGNLVHGGALISCPHGGRAGAVSAATGGVRADGLPVPTGAATFTVSGCLHTVDGVPQPCTTIRFSPDPGGVLIDGAPVLLDTTPAQCLTAALVPQGPPVVSGQWGVFCG